MDFHSFFLRHLTDFRIAPHHGGDQKDREKAEKLVRSIFKNIDMTDIGKENEFAFVTPKEKEAEINNKINILINDESVSAISNTIRFER